MPDAIAGLPGAGAAGGSQLDELEALATRLDLGCLDLGDLVHDIYSARAAAVNNEGLRAQLAEILGEFGAAAAGVRVGLGQPAGVAAVIAEGVAVPSAPPRRRRCGRAAGCTGPGTGGLDPPAFWDRHQRRAARHTAFPHSPEGCPGPGRLQDSRHGVHHP